MIDLKTKTGKSRFYNSKEWHSIRRIVLVEHPWCVECLKEGRYILAQEVDHIERLEDAPERCIDVSNLQGLCKSHHSKKTFAETDHGFCKKTEMTVVNKKWQNLKLGT